MNVHERSRAFSCKDLRENGAVFDSDKQGSFRRCKQLGAGQRLVVSQSASGDLTLTPLTPRHQQRLAGSKCAKRLEMNQLHSYRARHHCLGGKRLGVNLHGVHSELSQTRMTTAPTLRMRSPNTSATGSQSRFEATFLKRPRCRLIGRRPFSSLMVRKPDQAFSSMMLPLTLPGHRVAGRAQTPTMPRQSPIN